MQPRTSWVTCWLNQVLLVQPRTLGQTKNYGLNLLVYPRRRKKPNQEPRFEKSQNQEPGPSTRLLVSSWLWLKNSGISRSLIECSKVLPEVHISSTSSKFEQLDSPMDSIYILVLWVESYSLILLLLLTCL